jgi:6-phosphogluconolactonase
MEPAAKYLADLLTQKLTNGQKVLWLVTGGSGINVAVRASKLLKNTNLSNLHITLTDERYCPPKNKDSNWQQLVENGFNLQGANLYPVLKDESIEKTTKYYNQIMNMLLDECDYRIGLFGMGPDGHIAALFPKHEQLNEENKFVTFLSNSPKFPAERMTMTIPAIKKLDEAVVYAIGSEKHNMIENLDQNLSINEQPAQALKLLKKLTVFNDYKGEEV